MMAALWLLFFLPPYSPDLNPIELLWSKLKELLKTSDGNLSVQLKKLEAAGLVNLAYWENGFRNLSNSVRPVTKWEDFEGMKVRVMQNDIFLDTFQNLGANAGANIGSHALGTMPKGAARSRRVYVQ